MSASGLRGKFVTLIASVEGSEPIRRQVRKYLVRRESPFLEQCIRDGSTEIKIPLSRPENLHVILKYFNQDELVVSKKNLESLWNDARTLGLVDLQEACVQRMSETISGGSWVQRIQFAQAEGCRELENNVLNFVRDKFKKLCKKSSSFTPLSVDQVAQVLDLRSKKTAVTELRKMAVIRDWIKANEADRCSKAHLLVETVDLTKLSESSLRSLFDEESAFRHWRCVSIFQRAIRLKKFEEAMKESFRPNGFDLPIKQEVPPEDLLSSSPDEEDVKTNASDEDVSAAGDSDPSSPKMESSHGETAVVIDDKIYVIGGDYIGQISIECYDPVENTWTLVCETVDDHGYFDSVAVIDNPKHFFKCN